jgi:hypothetical protein
MALAMARRSFSALDLRAAATRSGSFMTMGAVAGEAAGMGRDARAVSNGTEIGTFRCWEGLDEDGETDWSSLETVLVERELSDTTRGVECISSDVDGGS